MEKCNSCGGVLGRDCFNPVECEEIGRQQEYQERYRADEEIHHLRQENSRLRSLMIRIYNSGYKAGHHDTMEAIYEDIHDCDMDTYNAETVEDILSNVEVTSVNNRKGDMKQMTTENQKPTDQRHDSSVESTDLLAVFYVRHPLTGDVTPIIRPVNESTTVANLMNWHKRHCGQPDQWRESWFDVRLLPMSR